MDLQWDGSNVVASLEEIRRRTVDKVCDAISWYEQARQHRKNGSKAVRIGAILFAGAGAMCPILDATKVFTPVASSNGNLLLQIPLLNWAVIFFAIAAGLVFYDRMFGLSSGWIRYMVTQLKLKKTLAEFEYDWTIEMVKLHRSTTLTAAARAGTSTGDGTGEADAVLQALQRLRKLAMEAHSQVESETNSWVNEFQQNLADLESKINARTEAAREKADEKAAEEKTSVEEIKGGLIKGGLIVVNVKNFAVYDEIMIRRIGPKADAEDVAAQEGSYIFKNVSAGQHLLTVTGKKAGVKKTSGQNKVDVKSGATHVVDIELEPPPAA